MGEPSWIGKREGFVKPRPARTIGELLSREMASIPSPPPKTRPWLAQQPVDFPPARSCSVASELKRYGTSPSRCHSPLRAELIRDGLIEVVLDEDGRWLGDRITEKGKGT